MGYDCTVAGTSLAVLDVPPASANAEDEVVVVGTADGGCKVRKRMDDDLTRWRSWRWRRRGEMDLLPRYGLRLRIRPCH